MDRYEIDGEYVYIPKEEPKAAEPTIEDLKVMAELGCTDAKIRLISVECPVCKELMSVSDLKTHAKNKHHFVYEPIGGKYLPRKKPLRNK